MEPDTLKHRIEKLATQTEFADGDRDVFEEFKAALRRGEIRAAEKDKGGSWKANKWVKRGILLGFRMGKIVEMSRECEPFRFFDKETFPPRPITAEDGIRIVPGGSMIRDGAYVASNT